MAVEIERKFLVDYQKLMESYAAPTQIFGISQAFLVAEPDLSVRVRVMTNVFDTADTKVKLGIKLGKGPVRNELEWDIDRELADSLLATYPSVHKTRSIFPDLTNEKRVWEVDVFDGKHKGLILAEIEIDDLDDEVTLPPWVGEEVTWNAEYYNCNLATQ